MDQFCIRIRVFFLALPKHIQFACISHSIISSLEVDAEDCFCTKHLGEKNLITHMVHIHSFISESNIENDIFLITSELKFIATQIMVLLAY